jgi:hypothetical protein
MSALHQGCSRRATPPCRVRVTPGKPMASDARNDCGEPDVAPSQLSSTVLTRRRMRNLPHIEDVGTLRI